jgi:hypothetical protein
MFIATDRLHYYALLQECNVFIQSGCSNIVISPDLMRPENFYSFGPAVNMALLTECKDRF